MIRTPIDKGALLGASLGLTSYFFLGFLTYRPTRLSGGISLSVWEAIPLHEALLLLGLWLMLLILSFLKGRHAGLNALAGISAGLVFPAVFWFAGKAALGLSGNENSLARISLGTGIWVMAIAAPIVLLASLRWLKKSAGLTLMVSVTGPALLFFTISSGSINELSILKEFIIRKDRFVHELIQHVTLAGLSAGIGTLLGVPLGILAFKKKKADQIVFFFANTIQTIPSLALFGLMMAPLTLLSEAFPVLRQFGIKGIGWTPALIALTLYSLLPIIRNAATSLRLIEPAMIDAGMGLGMSRWQFLFKVEVPLALPIIFSGIRTATLQSIGNTTVAALIGAGGLGTFVFQGLGQAAPDLILLGAIPVIFLALTTDLIMQGAITLLTPRGIPGGTK